MRPRARVERADDFVTIAAPYVAGFVAELKADVPGYARRWDPARRTWRVDSTFADEAIRTTLIWFDVTLTDRRYRAQSAGHGAPGGWAQAMFAALPEPLREPVYRVLIKVLHPDAGGDTSATQALTAAYDKSRGAR
jgi:hypothetical protein